MRTWLVCAALALGAGTTQGWRAAAAWGAVYVFGSQKFAGTVHITHGESYALPANGQSMAAALFAVCVWRSVGATGRDGLA